ncbi:MAG: exosortase/archaeosortase family protein [Acidobacteria bacterium]|nr:exosortase/archaeosortase family protein [Acidobacteriota bacterium]
MELIYARVLVKLVHDWYSIPDFSHGFLVPFFAAYVLWSRRDQLRTTPIRPSWTGVIVVVFALLVLLTGIYGADLFLSRISLLFLLIGLIWTFAGLIMLRAMTFPLAILLLAIPFPAIVFNQITFPLQLLASRVAGVILPLFGVPVLREGNVIQLPAMQLEVAEACSGIRSLMTLFTVAVVYGFFVEKSPARRWVLAIASIPIAVAANALRIVGTGLCVQYWDPDKALGFFHEFSGWLMFVISMICLYFTQKLIDWTAGRKASIS